MTIDPETLAAYAEGQLDAATAARVEAAIAADPALPDQLAAHHALGERLRAHFAPVLEMPVPDRLLDAVRQPIEQSNVVDLANARAAKAVRPRSPAFSYWLTGGAIAASLALGLGIGSQLPTDAPVGKAGGIFVAQGGLDKALTTQLASADTGPVRIFLSVRSREGRYCRVFQAEAMAGLACRDDGRWAIDRLQSNRMSSGGEYRQAGSALGDIMARAQAIGPSGPLNKQDESAARARDWN